MGASCMLVEVPEMLLLIKAVEHWSTSDELAQSGRQRSSSRAPVSTELPFRGRRRAVSTAPLAVDPHSDLGGPWLRGARKRHACKEEREVPRLTFSYCCYRGWRGKSQRPFHFMVCQDAKAKGFESISVQPITKVFTVKGLLSCPVCSSFKHEGCPAEKAMSPS
uniref:Uncharacterized protein n=1 Tax=Myotis myotis TaxID=51298 RepID=A0A7J7WVU1_MYOMY|nr:hypothetical protein mMyoMyo1_011883 [Myotis myotis]